MQPITNSINSNLAHLATATQHKTTYFFLLSFFDFSCFFVVQLWNLFNLCLWRHIPLLHTRPSSNYCSTTNKSLVIKPSSFSVYTSTTVAPGLHQQQQLTSTLTVYLTKSARLQWQGRFIFAVQCYAYARPMLSWGVRLSVTFVYCVKTNKCIFKIFSPLGSNTILGFSYQTYWQYSDGAPPPLTSALNTRG